MIDIYERFDAMKLMKDNWNERKELNASMHPAEINTRYFNEYNLTATIDNNMNDQFQQRN